MDPPNHSRESERLQALEACNILDSQPAPEFDDVVDLVSRLCETPIALISFVDDHRQWFKAARGLDMKQTPRSQSICAHVILDETLTEIPDTLQDQRTADNPICRGAPNLRFYAGAPLLSETGLPLGTLCVLDHKPRKLNATQKQALTVLAAQVSRLIDLQRALQIEQVLRDEMDHRVKNSLQSVLSVMRLYRAGLSDDESRTAFEAVERRVDAVASLHEALYSHDDVGTVRLHDYVGRVIDSLARAAPRKVTLNSAIAPTSVLSDVAVNLAIIVSEFCANAIKHAFPGNRPGRIDVDVTLDETSLVLRCRDDGVGTTVAPAQPSGNALKIGMRIMESAALQIDATLDHERSADGFGLTLSVPQHRLTARGAAPLATSAAG